ncbi:MAG: DUF3376 domain-containing protein [Ilumatobacteraceae bacterium]
MTETVGAGDGSTLRLALGMRGGVSLAVWIGGAAAEIDELRVARADADQQRGAFHRQLLDLGGYTDVEVDVMSGASAGGLNAVLACSAMIGRRRVAEMRETWMRVAGLRELLESDVGTDHDRRSLLGGEYFRNRVLDEVHRLRQPPPDTTIAALDHRLEVFLSATVHHGVHVQIEDDDYSPDAARRSGGLFHFRHLAATPSTSDLVGAAPEVVDAQLADAARTTASFPTAFEPVRFDCGAMPGVLLLPAIPTSAMWLLDGGIVDNIPVAHAIEGVPDVPAIDVTDRWLIYLQPSPDLLTPVAAEDTRRPTLLGVASGLASAFMSETILDDVEVLRRHNVDAADAATAWTAALAPLADTLRGGGRPGSGATSMDAGRVHALLVAPLVELQWRPIGMAVDPSPLGAATSSQLTDLRVALTSVIDAQPTPVRPFAPIARTAALLTQWARAVQRRSAELARDAGAVKLHCYHLMQLAQLLGTHVDLAALDTVTADPRSTAGEIVAAMSKAIADLDSDDDVLALVHRLPLRPVELAAGAGDDPGLAALYAGTMRPTVRAAGVPGRIADAMWEALGGAAHRLGALDAPRAPSAGDVDLRPVHAAVAAASDPAAVIRVLRAVDDLTAGVHHGIAAALPTHLQYLRIAGSNVSPLCLRTSDLAYAGPRFTEGELVAPHGKVAAGDKLAGASLGNFSAFISERWRANDWMWGRLDAAKSLVDLTTTKGRMRGDHPQLVAAIEAIVTRPFSLPPTCPSGWTAELDAAAADLWARHRDTVNAELRSERDDGETIRLHVTKQLLVLRRQWEILAEELPGVLASSLRPEPPARTAASAAPAKVPATLATAVADYQISPRSFGDVWGRSWSTALGVRSAYALWSATRPQRRLWRWLRVPLKPAPISTLGIVLARSRGLFALALVFNVVLVIRLRGLVAWLVLLLGGSVAVMLGRLYRRRRWRPERGAPVFVGLTIASFAAGAALSQWPAARRRLFDLPADAALTHFDRHLLNPYTWMATGASLVAMWLLWSWARFAWRVFASLLGAGIVGFWAMFSRMKPVPGAGTWLRLAFAFRPILWAGVAAVAVTTSLAHLAFHQRWRIADYKHG